MTEQDRFLRLGDVKKITGLGRSTIYDLIKRGEFPQQVNLSRNLVAWLESEVRDWQHVKVSKRDGEPRVAA